MIPQFIEVTDLYNNTFLINTNDIVLVQQVIGRPHQLELTVKFPEKSEKYTIQANYKEFCQQLGIRN